MNLCRGKIHKKACAVSIIGGADGPTSIFLAGKWSKDRNLIRRVKNFCRTWNYRRKRKKADAKIVPCSHSLQETRQYMKERYKAIEADQSYPNYEERSRQMKYALIQRKQPQLIGADRQLIPPDGIDLQNQQALQEWMQTVENHIKECMERMDQLPKEAFPTQYYFYTIDTGDGQIEIEMEEMQGIMGISSSGNLKKLQKIIIDIYLYYGVTQEDIDMKTDRYQLLLSELSQ